MGVFELPPQLITLQIPLLYLTNIIALAIGPKHQFLRVSISLPILVLLVAQSLYRQWDAGWGNHYAINCLVWSIVFIYVDWILLCSPDNEGWRKIRYQDPYEKSQAAVKKSDDFVAEKISMAEMNTISIWVSDDEGEEGFWERMWWGLRLVTTNRYTGWSQQVKNVPKRVEVGYPRLRFILRALAHTALFYLLRDIIVSYTASTPHGTWFDIRSSKPYQPFPIDTSFWYRFHFVWVHILLTFVSMEFANCVYSFLAVSLGLAPPRDCPSMFGSIKDLHSVRRAWSSVWHQQCRRICSSPGIWLSRDVLGLRKGGFASIYTQLFAGFAISGFIHGAASMLVSRSFDDDEAIKCFLGQASIIMLEDHVIDLGKRMGFKDSRGWRMLGFVWTVLAIGWGVEPWVRRCVGNGSWVHDREFDFLGLGPGVIP